VSILLRRWKNPRPHRITPSAAPRTGGEALRFRTYSRDMFGPEVPEIGNCRPIIDRLIAPDGGRIFKTRGDQISSSAARRMGCGVPGVDGRGSG
jgi:hypothetical protein